MRWHWLALLVNALLPGLGHVLLGIGDKGLFLFVLTASTANLWFLSLIGGLSLLHHWLWQVLLGGVTLTLWAYTLWDSWRFFRRIDSTKKAYVEERLRRAALSYLQDDFPKAYRHLRKVLKRDPYNADAYFFLAVLAKNQGHTKEAERLFRRCILMDVEEKWREAICLLYDLENLSCPASASVSSS